MIPRIFAFTPEVITAAIMFLIIAGIVILTTQALTGRKQP